MSDIFSPLLEHFSEGLSSEKERAVVQDDGSEAWVSVLALRRGEDGSLALFRIREGEKVSYRLHASSRSGRKTVPIDEPQAEGVAGLDEAISRKEIWSRLIQVFPRIQSLVFGATGKRLPETGVL